MNTRSGIRQWTMVAIAALGGSACDGESPIEPGTPVTPVASVEVTGPLIEVPVGVDIQLAATPRAANGSALPGRAVTWSSSDTMVAKVSAAGLLTARAAGVVTIRATSEGKTGGIELGIIAMGPAVTRITLTPGAAVLVVGATRQYQAVAFDANGQIVTGLPVNWRSSDSSRVKISETGLVTALAHGYTDIHATIGGHSVAVALTITQPEPQIPVFGVTVMPRERPVWVGGQLQMTAHPYAQTGGELHGRQVTWTSESPAIATVSANGQLTARAAGTVRIRAESEGRVGYATVRVRALPTGPVHEYKFDGSYQWRGGPIEIGSMPWTDANGVVHNAFRVIKGGTLRLIFENNTMPRWEQELTVETYLHSPMPQPPVARQTITTDGILWYNFLDGSYVLRNGTQELRTRHLFAGELVVWERFNSGPEIDLVWELK